MAESEVVKKSYTSKEINKILRELEKADYMYNENKFKTITIKGLELDEELDKDTIDLFKGLFGYKFKFTKDGEHKHDGQFVEYYFTFVSPSGVKTEFSTEMCLECWWNYHQEQEIL